jgi:Putative DNA-binding domain
MYMQVEHQTAFRVALLGGGIPVGLTAPDGDVERRFAVYRNNVVVGLIRALERRFPVLVRLVGTPFAAALFRAFLAEHPPRDPRLMMYGEALPGFLEGFPPTAGVPYLPDIARLELARGCAYHASDGEPAPVGAPPDPEAARLRLHPSLALVPSRYPVATIWAMHEPGRSPAPLDLSRAETALVARSGGAVLTRALAAGEAAFLAALLHAEPLGAAVRVGLAADPAFDHAACLAQAARERLVLGFELSSPGGRRPA